MFHVHPGCGEVVQFDEHMFQMGWSNHQPAKNQGEYVFFRTWIPGNFFLSKSHPSGSEKKITPQNMNTSQKKGSVFKRKFHLPTIDFHGILGCPRKLVNGAYK